MAKTKRYRMRFDFQLNVARDIEFALAETIGVLKSQGLYSKTIRDGIRLICDLRAGKLDVLFELFPWVRAEFLEYMASVQPQKSETEAEIQRQLKQIEELLKTTNKAPVSLSGVGEPKAMNVPQFAAPAIDDEPELVIKKAKSDGKQSAQNFLASAFALVD